MLLLMNSKLKEKRDSNIKFGCYIYQDGLRNKDILHIASECERLGYDSIWIKDNFIPWIQDYTVLHTSSKSNNVNNKNNQMDHLSEDRSQAQQHQLNECRMMLECWTLLSSLAPLTTKIKLGAILVNLYRNPAITAKMASTLDSISNGRLELGLSAGWYQKESKAYGIEFPTSGSTRVQMLEESIIIMKRMLQDNDGKISFKGKYYNILNAECNPKPIHKPHLPIWIGGGGKKTLKIVSKYADGWIYGLSSFNEYLQKLSILKDYCNSNKGTIHNRSYGDIIKGWHGVLLLGKDKNDIRKRKMKLNEKQGAWKNSKLVISGTPHAILDEIYRYLNIGVTYFIIYFPDMPNTTSLQLFAKHVIPCLRNR
jgi:alkanesulfonate monooxygenase SsuD/methylene tetrahydromethanopterin reductase-like flavin-dependent oxidoreductase (luciferase family)